MRQKSGRRFVILKINLHRAGTASIVFDIYISNLAGGRQE